MISFKVKTDFKRTNKLLSNITKRKYLRRVEAIAQLGLISLAENTPVDTGKTASSWRYRIDVKDEYTKIVWLNDNVTSDGTPIVILLQYGHMLPSGYYVQGLDFINPALKPIFERMAKESWEGVTA